MEISRDALMRVVSSTRAALRLAKAMNELLLDHAGTTWADEIAERLADSLYEFSGEKIENDQDFLNDSETMKLLMDPDLSDGEVTAAFVGMYRSNHPEQPKPNFINRDKMREQAKAGYGYMALEVKLK